ncbi:MAG: CDP-alcohol phosphatidyltransferase family protein [Anaeroplasmataceae bacterium]|nr:CDP-alcohol phosphatidyltransferase family protein [Anaeroplasmataceae bacterium]
MVGYYNYTVWLTYLSLLVGGVGICFGLAGNPFVAVVCLGISGIIDLFDGKVARLKKDRTEEEKSYGIQIDSLTDLVCFGVLPVTIGYAVGMNTWWFMPLMILYILSGMIRLAYFNVKEIHREEGMKKCFYGVPITTTAMVIPFIWLLECFLKENFYILYACILGVFAILFLVKIRLPKPSVKVSIIYASLLFVLFFVLLGLELALC